MIEINNLSKRYRNKQIFNHLTMSFESNRLTVLLGDNGAGKSTLIKILSGVLHPDSGLVRIDDKEYQDLTPRKAIEAGVSTVYQDLALGNTMDVASNLFLGSELTKYGFLKKKKMNEEARKLLNSLDIQIPDVTVPVGNLSGGQRQGVAVARLVHNGGKLLIFDEPTAAMGLNESNAVLKLIKKLAGEGFTVIIISHNLPHVFYISDRICVMRQGKVIKELKTQDTTMDEVVSMITGAITTD